MPSARAIFFGIGAACLLAVACASGTTLEHDSSETGSGGTVATPGPTGGGGSAGTAAGSTGGSTAGTAAGGTGAAGAGAGGTGAASGACDPQWKAQMGEASCDTCMLSSCCEALAGCDYGTACELLNQCIDMNCSTAADFEGCANQFCPTYMTTPALDAWNSRATCASGQCASSCSGGGGGTGGGAGTCDVIKPNQTGNPTCDACVAEKCCSTLQNCDVGTECGELQDCGDLFCDGALDFVSCLEFNCSFLLTAGAVAAWNARSDCMNEPCLPSCL